MRASRTVLQRAQAERRMGRPPAELVLARDLAAHFERLVHEFRPTPTVDTNLLRAIRDAAQHLLVQVGAEEDTGTGKPLPPLRGAEPGRRSGVPRE